MVNNEERVMIIFDGDNFSGTVRGFSQKIDYVKLIGLVAQNRRIYNVVYFISRDVPQNENQEKFIFMLKMNDIDVIAIDKEKITDPNGFVKNVGYTDFEIYREALMNFDHYDRLILATGDGDFTILVEILKIKFGKLTEIVSTPHNVNESLKEKCKFFWNLADYNYRDRIFRDSEELNNEHKP